MTEFNADVQEGKVCIVNLNPGEVRIEFLSSLLDTIIGDLNDRRVISYIRPVIAGPLLDIYRNRAVEWFLKESTAEWMLFIDSDITWTLDDLYSLLDSADPIERPVVSGVYLMIMQEGLRPGVWHRYPETSSGNALVPWPDDLEWPDNQLIEVDGTGAGFLLMHRSLLATMAQIYPHPMPWFANEIIDGVVHGEDFTFCSRVQQMGFRVIVNSAVQLDHIKHATFHVATFNDGINNRKQVTPPIGATK